MANRKHLQVLKQGVEAWNTWRSEHRNIWPDLSSADLYEINLADANLLGGNLTGASLSRVNLIGADLIGADLTHASLNDADLTHANLAEATLAEANLCYTNLHGANLTHANLTYASLNDANLRYANLTGADVFGVSFDDTDFIGTNLTAVRGLETCKHAGPSTLDHRTLAKSGPLPLVFLRGCGLPEALINYLPSLLNEPFQFYSCFISHASKDHTFADRLYDKLLLVLSKTSVTSQWVEQEVETALARERQQGTTILFPVRIDDTVMTLETGWPALIRNTRNIGDFRRWKTHDVYQKAFDRLLRDLKAVER